MSDEAKKFHGNSVFKPEYCKILIDYMSQGYSFASFGSEIMVGRQTLYDWIEKYPEFKEAKEIAEQMALRFFETGIMSATTNKCIDDKILQRSFDPKNINVPTMQWFIKTRFHKDYSEKSVTVLEGGDKPIKVEGDVDLSKFTLEELKQLQLLKAKLDEPTKS